MVDFLGGPGRPVELGVSVLARWTRKWSPADCTHHAHAAPGCRGSHTRARASRLLRQEVIRGVSLVPGCRHSVTRGGPVVEKCRKESQVPVLSMYLGPGGSVKAKVRPLGVKARPFPVRPGRATADVRFGNYARHREPARTVSGCPWCLSSAGGRTAR